MNALVNELTRKLGAAIQQDENYLEYIRAKEANDKNEDLQQKIQQLNLIRIQYNAELSKPSAEQDREKISKLSEEFNTVYNEIMSIEDMVKFNMAKAEVDAMMNRISGILSLCVNGEDPETCEPVEGCSSDCSSCAGCN